MNLSNLLPAIEAACDLQGVRTRLDGATDPVVLGVSGAAKGAVVASLASAAQRPLLLITPKPPQALALAEEIAAWLGPTVPVLSFPERDALPYERVTPDPDALRERLQALEALQRAEPAVVVASGIAVGQRTLPAGEETIRSFTLHTNERTSPDALMEKLLALGYRPAQLVEEPGEAARRGGIIDLFPAASDAPVRIEFFGDEIESLRRFGADDQRSAELVESIPIGPAREALSLAGGIRHLASQIDASDCTPEVRERFEEELARLQEGDTLQDESFYVPFLASGSLVSHLAEDGLLVIDEPADLAVALEEHDEEAEEIRRDLEARGELPAGLPRPHATWPELRPLLEQHPRRLDLSRWAVDASGDEGTRPAAGEGAVRLPFATPDGYGGRVRALASGAAETASRGCAVVIVSQQSERLAEVLTEEGVGATLAVEPDAPEPGQVVLVHGSLPNGWRLTTSDPPLTLLTDNEVFGFTKQRRRLPKRTGGGREAFIAELSPGDHVVHIEHGIARFSGMVRRRVNDVEREYLELRYAQGDKLYVPAEQVDRLSRFVGPSEDPPGLTRLGTQEWSRAKERVRRAVADLAKDLLELYASRQLSEGRAFSEDTPWQQELEASFPYVETPDQLAAVRAVKDDMMKPTPMDRLVCGDVGYGKTEVAVRAAFKAVTDGTQVAILVPTTVLAQQHFTTFRERLSGFPARIEMLSRFRSPKEQREVVEGLTTGSVDIVIGTHRLLQRDIRFKDLGLVIIDEEQRFGVANKERLKQMRQQVDVLTLSATPIPRTLHMSLSGIRDMSTMETPPEERFPIKTYVSEFDERLVREAILRELERGGQVYFVHNRVHDIELVASKLRDLVPEANISIGHGQQPEDVLEQTMLDFVDGRTDVLVCTTIIESGLDIPNVNTIIIDKADKLGLAQLYQLRGRVGRGAARAYAYLLFDKYRSLRETAQKRLEAIFEATELGAGFQIALRDLEIRGAGNLLGSEQSGQIGAVGFDLYVRLLADAVERLKALRDGKTPPPPKTQQAPLTIDLPLAAHLPPAYVDDLNLRLALYQRMALVETLEGAEAIAQELRDRFGPPPPAAQHLLYAVRVRALARQAGVASVQHENGDLVIRTSDGASPRDLLAAVDVRGLRTGLKQARLNLKEAGEGWQEALTNVLGALEKANSPSS